MATTSRANRKKSVKKIVKKTIQKKQNKKKELLTHLTESDLRYIENFSKDVQISKAKMNIQEQFLKNLTLECRILELSISNERDRLKSVADVFESSKNKYTEFKKSISDKYGLMDGDNLGYNPDTGEIIK